MKSANFKRVIAGTAQPNVYQKIALRYLNEYGAQWKVSAHATSGIVHWDSDSPTLVTPDPSTARALYIFLHELGHVKFGHRPGRQDIAQSVAEYDAEMFAQNALGREDIPLNKAQESWGHEYIGRWVATELTCGEPEPPARVMWYAGSTVQRFAGLSFRKIWAGTNFPKSHFKVLERYCAEKGSI